MGQRIVVFVGVAREQAITPTLPKLYLGRRLNPRSHVLASGPHVGRRVFAFCVMFGGGPQAGHHPEYKNIWNVA